MNSISIVVGNICSLLAMGTDAISSAQKTAKRVLCVQNISQLIYCTGTIVLKGYSGAAQNGVSIVRNFLAIKQINCKWAEWAVVLLGVILGLWFNNLGWIGLLPVIANLQYTLAVFQFRNSERALKISFLIAAVMFGIFNLALFNFVGLCTNMAVAGTTAVFLIKSRRSR